MLAGTARAPITIGWGRHDKVTLPRQARTAQETHGSTGSRTAGHFPFLDEPAESVRVILESTG